MRRTIEKNHATVNSKALSLEFWDIDAAKVREVRLFVFVLYGFYQYVFLGFMLSHHVFDICMQKTCEGCAFHYQL